MSSSRVLIPVAGVVLAAVVVGGLAVTGNLPAFSSEGRKQKQLTSALDDLAATSPDFAVAVLDKANDTDYSYEGSEEFDTASIVKVSILACTELRAQDEKADLTDEQQSLAEKSIRASDNDATTALFKALGSADGLTACDERLGMKETEVNAAWGLTKTTADDQARLLGNLVSDDSELEVERRQYVFDLMGSVNADQDWGVPSAAKEGESAPVKNGWDTRSADDNLWVVNSIGRIVSDDRDTNVSVVVLTRGDKTQEDGIALVEKIAALTREKLGY
ncbi:serine hydrolase [Actinoplanes sp. NPDC051851]|uniref:serine hydrolase n=1 Tax=Actinoplanes sp. NPDC051851 TaxID=3154753 RepID=UPI00343E6F70